MCPGCAHMATSNARGRCLVGSSPKWGSNGVNQPGASLDLAELKCLRLTEQGFGGERLPGSEAFAEGISVYRASALYFPGCRRPVVSGFVPEESINYPLHYYIGQRSYAVMSLESVDRTEEEVCILGNVFSHVFGHWMEELLKVIVLESFGFGGSYVVARDYPRFCAESLELLGVESRRLQSVDKVTLFENAFFTSNVNHFNAHLFPELTRRLRDQLYAAVGQGGGVGERVWADRGESANQERNIVNFEEVSATVKRHGFSCCATVHNAANCS
jgi:Glycosyltransferase 61